MTKELLNVSMESSDIDEAWVRKNFMLAKERKTSTKTINDCCDLDEEYPFGYTSVEYDNFFDIFKLIIDVRILQSLVRENVTCDEKFIKIKLEMATNSWHDDEEASVNIQMEYRHTETTQEIIKRLIASNKRALAALKRKAEKQTKMASMVAKMSEKERRELLAELLI